MMLFLVSNPTRFACGSLVFPTMICVFKLVITILAEFASMFAILYMEDELLTLKLFSIMVVVASFDGKMVGIFQGIS